MGVFTQLASNINGFASSCTLSLSHDHHVTCVLHRKCGLDLQRVLNISYRPHVLLTRGGFELAPVSYHMTRPVPWSLVPEVVHHVADEQAALYAHALFALRDPEVGEFSR